MNVFLVPVGAGRHALYCEVREADADPDAPPADQSWRARLLARFRRTVAAAEAEREREELGEQPRGRGFARAIVRRIAEAVAEQRLLWHLRRADAACLVHPTTMPGAEALGMARAEFAADYRKHLTRAVINGIISAVVGVVLFFVPGPNLVAYYFLFLAIGHYFALRGASRGLRGVEWTTEPSSPLADIPLALILDKAERRARLEAITTELGLGRLWRFVERVAKRPA
ncbi:MAG TPA: hypothetical protein VMM93_08695 [Vicinamibacterales bacterium]|nr:hypothetical protein [Vicinamibacterales bacterium]